MLLNFCYFGTCAGLLTGVGRELIACHGYHRCAFQCRRSSLGTSSCSRLALCPCRARVARAAAG